jgi:hypothetical protein
MIVIDSIDFMWAQPSPNRSEPEDLIHDVIFVSNAIFVSARTNKRHHRAGEFARSSTFKAHCKKHNIVIEEVR